MGERSSVVAIYNEKLEINKMVIKVIMKIIKIIIETNYKSNNNYYDNGNKGNHNNKGIGKL